MGTDIRELLAAYAHEAWSSYMKHFFKQCRLRGNGSVVVPAEYVTNLRCLMDRYMRVCQNQSGIVIAPRPTRCLP